VPGAERDPAPDDVDAGPLQGVQRARLGLRDEAQRRGLCSCPVVGVGRGQRAGGARTGGSRQLGRSLQEGRGRRQSPAHLGASGRAFELVGHLLVGPGRRHRAVPGTPVRVALRIGDVGQGLMRLPTRR